MYDDIRDLYAKCPSCSKAIKVDFRNNNIKCKYCDNVSSLKKYKNELIRKCRLFHLLLISIIIILYSTVGIIFYKNNSNTEIATKEKENDKIDGDKKLSEEKLRSITGVARCEYGNKTIGFDIYNGTDKFIGNTDVYIEVKLKYSDEIIKRVYRLKKKLPVAHEPYTNGEYYVDLEREIDGNSLKWSIISSNCYNNYIESITIKM